MPISLSRGGAVGKRTSPTTARAVASKSVVRTRGYAAGRLGRAAQRRFNEVLKPSELTPRHLQVLDELREGL
jgi:DNA-binding NarL/FixJ family response regulator